MSILKKSFRTLREFSAFLLFGTALSLLWANIDYEGYHHLIEGTWFTVPWLEYHGHALKMNFHFFANDIFMVLFFGIAGKEVSESFLPGGALSSLQKASMPMVGTLGGVVVPIGTFFALSFALGLPGEVIEGAWAVPAATDIAYAWLFAGLIFGRGHPAVTFLLVLAIVDDMIGMAIIATYYTANPAPMWLLLVLVGMVLCEVMRRVGVKNFWPYLLVGGPLAWLGLFNAGVHASLALVPIIPFMPHAERDAGLFVEDDDAHDTMHDFEEIFAPVVDVGLFMFGFANAGVVLTGEALTGSATWIIFLSLVVGKTVGIPMFCIVAEKLGLSLPEGMKMRELPALGAIAGIGFTVALFMVAVAGSTYGLTEFAGGKYMPMLKLGALMSFGSAGVAYILSKVFDTQYIPADAPAADSAGH